MSDMTPYEFYRSIGSPKRIIAPMVDHSDLAFRMMCRKYKADLTYTQMFNASQFVVSEVYRNINFTTCEYDRPLIVQLAGDDPDIMLQAALCVQDKCDAIDINIGCPQGIAKRGHYGAFLMEELELLAAIVSKLKKHLRIPVTCKTRIYKDFDRALKLYETLVQAGASLLTIHGRTREEKGHEIAACDWETIRRVKAHFGDRIPIIANGGVECYADYLACMQITGCDGVMVSGMR
jgi:tRNA-dihydrouridine synthase 1